MRLHARATTVLIAAISLAFTVGLGTPALAVGPASTVPASPEASFAWDAQDRLVVTVPTPSYSKDDLTFGDSCYTVSIEVHPFDGSAGVSVEGVDEDAAEGTFSFAVDEWIGAKPAFVAVWRFKKCNAGYQWDVPFWSGGLNANPAVSSVPSLVCPSGTENLKVISTLDDTDAPYGWNTVVGLAPTTPLLNDWDQAGKWISTSDSETSWTAPGLVQDFLGTGEHMATLSDFCGNTIVGPDPYVQPGTSPFTDVNPSQLFAKEMSWMYDNNVSTGWGTGQGRTYQPLSNVHRDAMAAFLYRAAGRPQHTPPAVSPFVDVRPGDQFYAEITWMYATGISRGWETPQGREFRPLADINRDAMAAFLYRAVGSPTYDPPVVSPFVDISPSGQFYAEMSWLSASRISTGWSNQDGTRRYGPLQPIHRDAMAAFLFRTYAN